MNKKREIKTLKGETIPMNFPDQSIIDGLPKNAEGKPDTKQLPRETVGNVILSCLSFYAPEKQNRVDGFMANAVAALMLEDSETIDLQKKYNDFVINVVTKSIIKTTETSNGQAAVGVYFGWIIAQALEELGVTEE